MLVGLVVGLSVVEFAVAATCIRQLGCSACRKRYARTHLEDQNPVVHCDFATDRQDSRSGCVQQQRILEHKVGLARSWSLLCVVRLGHTHLPEQQHNHAESVW